MVAKKHQVFEVEAHLVLESDKKANGKFLDKLLDYTKKQFNPIRLEWHTMATVCKSHPAYTWQILVIMMLSFVLGDVALKGIVAQLFCKWKTPFHFMEQDRDKMLENLSLVINCTFKDQKAVCLFDATRILKIKWIADNPGKKWSESASIVPNDICQLLALRGLAGRSLLSLSRFVLERMWELLLIDMSNVVWFVLVLVLPR